MKYIPKIFIDKKAREITVREAEENDAEQLIDCITKYIKDSNHQVLLPYEFAPSINEETYWIISYIKSSNSLLLVAEHQGIIIGNIDIRGGNKERIKHTAIIGMGLALAFRNQGIGNFLMQEITQWAQNHSSLELLWLQVFNNHSHAIHLYKKYGFEIVGNQKKFIKYKDGRYLSKIIMSLVLKK